MEAHVVIGANFGDEGKGTVAAGLAAYKDSKKVLYVLNNGGAQRGHTINLNGDLVTNKHFGSGTIFGCDTYFAENFLLDPIQFKNENDLNINYTSDKTITFYRHSDCKWVTPFDIMANQSDSIIEGKQNTCGMGIWRTITRYEDFYNGRPLNMSFDSFMLLDYSDKIQYLKSIAKYYKYTSMISGNYKVFFDDPIVMDNLINHFIADCIYMYQNTVPIKNTPEHEFIKYGYETVIFENGQGLGIQDTGSNISSTTPSFTGLRALPASMKFLYNKDDIDFNVHYVTRTYETRHGEDDYFKSIEKKSMSSYIKDDTNNHYNQWQGEFKYHPLNVMAMNGRIYEDLKFIPKELENKVNIILDITHCDEIGPENIYCKAANKINLIGTSKILSF